jgi:GcrA cell cycle regulator
VAEWSEAEVETLKKLCAQGLAFSQIAERMGMTRSSILGKAFRMKLRKNPATPTRTRKRYPVTDAGKRILTPPHVSELKEAEAAMKDAVQKEEPRREPKDGAPVPLNLELVQLTATACKWPVNDGGPFLFCGHEKTSGATYCEFHERLAFSGRPPLLRVSRPMKRAA